MLRLQVDLQHNTTLAVPIAYQQLRLPQPERQNKIESVLAENMCGIEGLQLCSTQE